MADAFSSGTLAGAGSFRCEGCGFALALQERDELPECPDCGGDRFRRALLFEPEAHAPGHHDVEGAPGWLSSARERIDSPGDYLAYAGEERAEVVALEPGWTRVGRSLSADLRFDDPTASRRHALVYHAAGGGARILDDRSLNGVFVNGERVDLAELSDGDEIAVGRYTLFFLRSLDEPPERPEPSSPRSFVAT
jgi:predicted  nucleic acid-binding Zn-ribbon protein